jgi:hypothetical protein
MMGRAARTDVLGGLMFYTAVAATVMALLPGCGKKEEAPAPQPVQQATAPTENPAVPTVDQALEAMLRAHRADKACYDSGRDAYFLHYKEPGAKDTDFAGWYYVEKIGIYYVAANKSFFAITLAADHYLQAGPDVDGLPCKDKR